MLEVGRSDHGWIPSFMVCHWTHQWAESRDLSSILFTMKNGELKQRLCLKLWHSLKTCSHCGDKNTSSSLNYISLLPEISHFWRAFLGDRDGEDDTTVILWSQAKKVIITLQSQQKRSLSTCPWIESLIERYGKGGSTLAFMFFCYDFG